MRINKYWLLVSLIVSSGTVTNLEGQLLKKLGKRAERAAERTVERRVDREVSKKTDQTLDSILEPGNKGNPPEPQVNTPPPSPSGKEGDSSSGTSVTSGSSTDPKNIEVYSKFDFVPGDNVIFFDDFANDLIGDFPSKWNTNGSGEIVTVGEEAGKWFEVKPGYNIVYIPDTPALPEEYTIEFDLMPIGLDHQTPSTAVLKVGVSDDTSFKWGKYANVDIPFCQYHPVGFFVRNGGDINNKIEGDIRQKVLDQPHISIAVNQQRLRMWVDESKYLDIPRMIPAGVKPVSLKFELRQFRDGKERLFIRNLKVAEGGLDLRRQLLENGSVSTTGILFESGSARLQPQSMGVIRQFYQVLQEEPGMKLRIIGHTDSDGDDASNLELSGKRAETVKNTLISAYGVNGSRLEAEGKGEEYPVADNSSPEGKAKNRRVEFIKI